MIGGTFSSHKHKIHTHTHLDSYSYTAIIIRNETYLSISRYFTSSNFMLSQSTSIRLLLGVLRRLPLVEALPRRFLPVVCVSALRLA